MGAHPSTPPRRKGGNTVVGYIVRRVIAAVLVLIVTSMMVFALFFWGPTNAATILCNQNGRCTAQKQALLEHQMGLDQSVVSQYGVWAKGIFFGRTIQLGATYDCPAPCFGISFRTHQPVTDELKVKFPATLSIAVVGGMLYLLFGVTGGVLAARKRGSLTDRGLVTSSLLLFSMPPYLVFLLAWLFLVEQWGLFPQTGYYPFLDNPLKWAQGLLLPWLVVGITGATQYVRFTRGTMVETLSEDYVRTATAKGVSEKKVVFKHGLRAAIVPIITLFGLDFAYLLAGTIFAEYIFGVAGIGIWSLEAIPVDFPVIQTTVLVAAGFVVAANLVVDVVYSFLDPRVRLA
jgi:peptide/nickel transport system permease protein